MTLASERAAPRPARRPDEEGHLFSLAEAARIWGMSENTLRRRVRCGWIEVVRSSSSSSCLFIEARTLNALLAARWCSREENDLVRCCASTENQR